MNKILSCAHYVSQHACVFVFSLLGSLSIIISTIIKKQVCSPKVLALNGSGVSSMWGRERSC